MCVCVVCIAVPIVRWRSVRCAAVRRPLSSSLLGLWQASRQLPEMQDSVLGKEILILSPPPPPPLPHSPPFLSLPPPPLHTLAYTKEKKLLPEKKAKYGWSQARHSIRISSQWCRCWHDWLFALTCRVTIRLSYGFNHFEISWCVKS